MARKTFISYKYSEAQDLRDRIIDALGEDAVFYKGETSESPDLTDTSTENIKSALADMMFDTSVTIVIVSPCMTKSKWIPWEISYCLKKITRKNRTSHMNGIVAVIKKVDGGYSWLKNIQTNCHGQEVFTVNNEYLPEIIRKNRYNSVPPKIHCPLCGTFDYLNGSYIALIEEDAFLDSPSTYIENAFSKSENDAEGYEIEL